jgi:serine kinase of HPr protein (carbohydrate metabolism regulator)
MPDTPTVHASAVLVGPRAILIRGPSGSGKSRLALGLIRAGKAGHLPIGRLVADDRVQLEASHGRILARPVPSLAGLIEARGLGIHRLAYEAVAVVGFVADLAASDAQRLPKVREREAVIENIVLPRLAVAAGEDPLPMVLTWLGTDAAPA